MSILDYFKNNTSYIEKNLNQTKEDINIYTDGACSNNGRINAKAGIGIYISDDFKISERLIGIQTNQRAELYAILKALLIIDILKYKNINIYTDSMYSINCITKWIKFWKKNKWLDKKNKPIKNRDLIENIDKIIIKYSHINFNHIQAHTNKTDIHSLNNAKVDKLAKESLNI